MCAYALHCAQISRVVYACNNDKFGGAGGILSINSFPENADGGKPFEITAGILKDEAVWLLKEFY
jgi:tRNA-specific adenosine deaminase 2